MSDRGRCKRDSGGAMRRGVATVWLIVLLPCILVALCLVMEIANLWMARAELEDALEAAALAAVKEWGDAGGGDTLLPRQIGDAYASSNSVRRVPVSLSSLDPTLNYNAANPNDNRICPDGVLLFGAITETDPEVVLDTTRTPGCDVGEVLFDVSESNLTEPTENAWGINFRPADPMMPPPAGLRISEVVYDLRAGVEVGGGDPGNDAIFDLENEPPEVSPRDVGDSPAPIIVSPPCAGSLDDTAGLDDSPLTPLINGNLRIWFNSQVRFVWDTTQPWILRVQFPYTPGDPQFGDGFEPGDRLRFGAATLDLGRFTGGGSAALDEGDAVGRARVKVTVTFAIDANDLPNLSAGYFEDSDFGQNFANPNNPNTTPPPPDIDCRDIANYPYVLPPPPARGRNNDNQSYVRVGGGGGLPFAVRALAEWDVAPLCDMMFGVCLPTFRVKAETVAIYDCDLRRPRLIRIDRIICP